MISMLTRTARRVRSTLDSIATPCSVKAYGAVRRPPRPPFEITDCDLKDATSDGANRNMKSAGKRAALRLTACTSSRVCTPYNAARSASSMTLWPRSSRMARWILGTPARADGIRRLCTTGAAPDAALRFVSVQNAADAALRRLASLDRRGEMPDRAPQPSEPVEKSARRDRVAERGAELLELRAVEMPDWKWRPRQPRRGDALSPQAPEAVGVEQQVGDRRVGRPS